MQQELPVLRTAPAGVLVVVYVRLLASLSVSVCVYGSHPSWRGSFPEALQRGGAEVRKNLGHSAPQLLPTQLLISLHTL